MNAEEFAKLVKHSDYLSIKLNEFIFEIINDEFGEFTDDQIEKMIKLYLKELPGDDSLANLNFYLMRKLGIFRLVLNI